MGMFGDVVEGVRSLATGKNKAADAAYNEMVRKKKAEEAAKAAAAQAQRDQMDRDKSFTGDPAQRMKERGAALKEYKKGGIVDKTGSAKLHKAERVLTVPQTKKLAAKPQVMAAIGIKPKKKC